MERCAHLSDTKIIGIRFSGSGFDLKVDIKQTCKDQMFGTLSRHTIIYYLQNLAHGLAHLGVVSH